MFLVFVVQKQNCFLIVSHLTHVRHVIIRVICTWGDRGTYNFREYAWEIDRFFFFKWTVGTLQLSMITVDIAVNHNHLYKTLLVDCIVNVRNVSRSLQKYNITNIMFDLLTKRLFGLLRRDIQKYSSRNIKLKLE